nr:PREDICTED: uncharacterized protein LOC107397793 [Tribolium castaneum]|eukprot:XP_015834791.1 PREDICTED: uncharacterized protein LOC107397793 [Tribolium castaneum]
MLKKQWSLQRSTRGRNADQYPHFLPQCIYISIYLISFRTDVINASQDHFSFNFRILLAVCAHVEVSERPSLEQAQTLPQSQFVVVAADCRYPVRRIWPFSRISNIWPELTPSLTHAHERLQ